MSIGSVELYFRIHLTAKMLDQNSHLSIISDLKGDNDTPLDIIQSGMNIPVT